MPSVKDAQTSRLRLPDNFVAAGWTLMWRKAWGYNECQAVNEPLGLSTSWCMPTAHRGLKNVLLLARMEMRRAGHTPPDMPVEERQQTLDVLGDDAPVVGSDGERFGAERLDGKPIIGVEAKRDE